LDGTLTKREVHWENYLLAEPDHDAITRINQKYNEGNRIVIHTARPYSDWKVTVRWLKLAGVKYHCMIMGKLRADLYVDNDSKRISEL
jgi:hypothetical protein